MPFEERNNDTEHYIAYDAYRKILFINPSVEVLAPKDYQDEASLVKWVDDYLYPKRGIYFAPANSTAKRIRRICLKTWVPERMLCSGFNHHDQLPALT